MATVKENIGWCNVCCNSGVNEHGIGVLQLNYGYPDGAKRFRENIAAQSTNTEV